MLGVRRDLALDALHSERAAKAALSRRGLFAAAGAMATGSVFSFPVPAKMCAWSDLRVYFNGVRIPAMVTSYAVTIKSHGEPRWVSTVEVF
jgi:hypothetical protein